MPECFFFVVWWQDRTESANGSTASSAQRTGDAVSLFLVDEKTKPIWSKLFLSSRSRFGETGASPGQLDSPHGFCLGVKGEIIVAGKIFQTEDIKTLTLCKVTCKNL